MGCSGWSYPHWRGTVYPVDLPQRRWFTAYAELFDTVELNSTFYRLPTEAAIDKWRIQAPDGFCYSVKVGRFGTHRKKLLEPEMWLPRHLDRIDGLGPTLGPQLLQLPPHWHANPRRLEEFFAVAPSDLRWVVEVRDPSWLCEEVYQVLHRHGAALCWHDLLPNHPWVATADFAYVRLHGPDAMVSPYGGRYGAERLEPIAGTVTEQISSGRDVFVYFNNDLEAAAVADATTLRLMLEPAA